MSNKKKNTNDKQLDKKKLERKFKVAPLVSRSLQALKERNFFP